MRDEYDERELYGLRRAAHGSLLCGDLACEVCAERVWPEGSGVPARPVPPLGVFRTMRPIGVCGEHLAMDVCKEGVSCRDY